MSGDRWTGTNTNVEGVTRVVHMSKRMTWQDAIDKLKLWEDPEYLREDELIPPTEAALDAASLFVLRAVTHQAPPPVRMVPDGNGGINFEARDGSSMEIDGAGQAESVVTKNRKVVGREAIYE